MQAWLAKMAKDFKGKVTYQTGYAPATTTTPTTPARPTGRARRRRRTRPGAAACAASRDGALLELQRLTERLRRDCPWDREQTAATIVPHTVEESYEVADAALAGDDEKLLDELGDLLFQVYFLALLLEERGAGDLAQVAPRRPREARAPASARLRRRRGANRRAGALELGAHQARAGGARGHLPRRRGRAAGAALRAQGPAAREGGRLRVPRSRRCARRPRRRAARAAGGAVGGATSSATSCSQP